jgi:hypothetical protein
VQEPARVLKGPSRASGVTRPASFEIAGVRFSLQGSAPAVPFPDAYRSFLERRFRGPSRITVPLTIRVDDRVPAPRDPVCRTEGWMLARGNDYTLALAPPLLGGRAAVTARFPPGVGRVAVTVADPGRNPLTYPVDQILMMHLLALRDGAILHAAGLGLGRRGFAFCGCSGAGKSTLARQLRRRPRWSPLSDDRVIVRRIGGTYRLFGTPWPGQGKIAVNGSFPCAGLVFLRHARENGLERLSARDALHRLLPVASVPWYDREPTDRVLDFLGELVERIPVWELAFRPDRTVGPFFERALGARARRRPPRQDR